MATCVVAGWRGSLFGKVRTLNSFENISEPSGFVLGRRVLPSLEGIQLFPWLFWFRNVDSRSCRTQARRFAKLRPGGPLSSLRSPSGIGKPVGNLHRLQLGLLLKLSLLFFGRIRVLLVHVQPLAEDLDGMAREANAITLRAARCIVASWR